MALSAVDEMFKIFFLFEAVKIFPSPYIINTKVKTFDKMDIVFFFHVTFINIINMIKITTCVLSKILT